MIHSPKMVGSLDQPATENRAAALPELRRVNGERIAWEPAVGAIYRDLHNRSLMVLSVHLDNTLVEFADGHTEVLDIFEWRDLQPTAALC